MNPRGLSEKMIKQFFKGLAKAVSYMNSLGIVHRDLKPENMLFNDNPDTGCIKIVDFGLATIIGPGELLKDKLGTPSYIAPEIFSN